MQPPFLVIADDLTGAADAAAVFTSFGVHPTIDLVHASTSADSALDRGGVLVLDTNSRDVPAQTAQAITRRAVNSHHISPSTIFKKIDSTLRGNIAAEVGAIIEATGMHVICAPAFPAAGRTTEGGVQLEHGLPLSEGASWGSASPTTGERPPRSVASTLQPWPTQSLDLATIRGNGAILQSLLARRDVKVTVCDAVVDDDLRRIVDAGLRAGRSQVWAGSAGLARALAAVYLAGAANGFGPHAHERVPPDPAEAFCLHDDVHEVSDSGRALVVIGSMSPVARAQASAFGAGWERIVTDAADLIQHDNEQHTHLSDAVLDATSRSDTLITVKGDVDRQHRNRVVHGLARVIAPATHRVSLLGLTGGATARAVLNEIGVSRIRVVRELEPGVVLTEPVQPNNSSFHARAILKPGSFGDVTTLVRALDIVKSKGASR